MLYFNCPDTTRWHTDGWRGETNTSRRVVTFICSRRRASVRCASGRNRRDYPVGAGLAVQARDPHSCGLPGEADIHPDASFTSPLLISSPRPLLEQIGQKRVGDYTTRFECFRRHLAPSGRAGRPLPASHDAGLSSDASGTRWIARRTPGEDDVIARLEARRPRCPIASAVRHWPTRRTLADRAGLSCGDVNPGWGCRYSNCTRFPSIDNALVLDVVRRERMVERMRHAERRGSISAVSHARFTWPSWFRNRGPVPTIVHRQAAAADCRRKECRAPADPLCRRDASDFTDAFRAVTAELRQAIRSG